MLGNTKWDGRMVARTSHNWLLKGIRFRNKRKTRRINQPGRYKSEKADPKELLLRRVPHLAFFDEAYYDRVIAKVDARNAKYRRNGNGTPDPCQDRPKKRTRFPGQTVYCGICGRLYVFGGTRPTGPSDVRRCPGVQVLERHYLRWPFGHKEDLQGRPVRTSPAGRFRPSIPQLWSMRRPACWTHPATPVSQEVNRELTTVQREIENVMKFIRGGDASERVRAELRQLEDREKLLLRQKDEIEGIPSQAIVIPSAAEIMEITANAFQDLAADSFEFAKRMRKLTGKIYVYPFRLCEGAPFVLRAKLRLRLAGLLPDKRVREALQKPLERVLKIDLFNMPQRVALREKVVAGRQEVDASGRKRTERDVAKSLGITITAAQRAAALDRLMKQQGLDRSVCPAVGAAVGLPEALPPFAPAVPFRAAARSHS